MISKIKDQPGGRIPMFGPPCIWGGPPGPKMVSLNKNENIRCSLLIIQYLTVWIFEN